VIVGTAPSNGSRQHKGLPFGFFGLLDAGQFVQVRHSSKFKRRISDH